MDERVTFCTRCSAVVPWGRFLCDVCLKAEVHRQVTDRARRRPTPPSLIERECRSCHAPVDPGTLACPCCGRDPRADLRDARAPRRPGPAGPWIAAIYLLVFLPLVAILMFVFF